MRQIRIVDVFTEKQLAGNQLAVVLDGRDLSSEMMQRIAREMNFSETTFIFPPEDSAHAAKVRIFTPGRELQFAGHPTIGTAWVLLDEGIAAGDQLTLEEGVGPIAVRSVEENGRTMLWMTFPEMSFGRVFPHASVATALGVQESDLVPDAPAQIASSGTPFLFAALRSPGAVDAAASDAKRLAKLLRNQAVGLFFFAKAGSHRFYSRMFAPDIAEDPATGSASGPLGGYAVKYGLVERAPKISLVSEQGTKMGRQSFLHIELAYREESPDIPSRIEVGGSVMPVLKGELL
jgi:trans-2,3-dihydro-3-hydroxyanthranilate isomerase